MAKPTIGFSTRTEAVLALRAAGKTTQEISSEIGIEPKSVRALEASAAKTIKRCQPGAMGGRTVLLPVEVLNRMRRPSAARGLDPHELALRIVSTVVMADLVDAVLDDNEGTDL